MTDLYKIYKQYYQRSYRRPRNGSFREMTDLSHDLVKKLYLNKHNKNRVEELRIFGIQLAEKLIEMERDERTNSIFGVRLLKALMNNRFDVDVPYPVMRRWLSKDINGEVYIMTSSYFLGQCKLGATTLDVNESMRKYENRYGYSVDLYYSLEIVSPFYFEKFISDLIKDKRVNGRSKEHTNEWYSISPEELQILIENNIGNFIKYMNEYSEKY